MKFIFVCLLAISFIAPSCKCCKDRCEKKHDVNQEQPVIGTTTGTVSHQFRETGCATVVIISGEEEITLIPMSGLPDELNVDGKIILFDYTTSRMPQPEGCMKGLPAMLTNVSEKK